MPSVVEGILLATLLAAIAMIDARTGRIPDWLSLPLLAFGLVLAATSARTNWPPHLIGAVAGYVSFAAFGEFFFRLRGREGLGLGDAKLFAAGGAWLGWAALPAILLISSLSALIYALLAGRSERQEEIAFGPWLALGIWVTWLFRTWKVMSG